MGDNSKKDISTTRVMARRDKGAYTRIQWMLVILEGEHMEKELARIQIPRGNIIVTNERLIVIDEDKSRKEIRLSDIRKATAEVQKTIFGGREYRVVVDIKFSTDTEYIWVGGNRSWASSATEVLDALKEAKNLENYDMDLYDHIDDD